MKDRFGIGFTGVVGEDIEEVHDRRLFGERAVCQLDQVVLIFVPGADDHGTDISFDAAIVTAASGGDRFTQGGCIIQIVLVFEDQQCAEQGLTVAAIAAGDAKAHQGGLDQVLHGNLLKECVFKEIIVENWEKTDYSNQMTTIRQKGGDSDGYRLCNEKEERQRG